MFKRNSGFIIGCVLTAGASFFASDVLMSDMLPVMEPEVQVLPETGTVNALEPEKTESRTYETDPFTVTAAGNIIKGVETESPKKETEEPETDENGNVIQPETDEEGNPVITTGETDASGNSVSESGSGDGSSGYSDDGSGSGNSDDGSDSYNGSYDGAGDGSYGQSGSSDGYYEEPIEIYDPGNGDYSYNDSGYDDGSWSGGDSGDNSSGGGNSGNDSPAWTPDDVIIQGISSRYLDVSELYSYGPATIRLIRNEIFALHGRIFQSQDLMDYFSQKSWYVPTYSPEEFDANMFDYLNDYEEANLKLILDYEDWLASQ